MLPTIDLTGKIALVTGVSRGIGFSVAARLAEAGAKVAANVRRLDADSKNALARLETACPGAIVPLEGSVDDPEAVSRMFRTIFTSFKRLDILVNNAGILRENRIGMIPEGEIDALLRTNLHGVISILQAASRLMIRGKGGSVINISSIMGVRGYPGHLAYGASKAGVIGATLSAARELAPHNIRVNAVAPGLIDTKMTNGIPEEARKQLIERIGLGRAGSTAEVADAVLFLASDLARYITGQVIGVDGGMVL
jgi:3-oxoacyl-[acyl-carrier protein] reductase